MDLKLQTLAVIGNGIIGHGITEVFSSAGIETILIGRSEASLAQAVSRIRTSLEEFSRRGLIEKGNITIRLVNTISPTLSRILEVFAAALVCVVLAALTWQIWLYAAKMARAKETTFVLQIPVAPFWFGVSVILACAVIVQVIVTIRALCVVFNR